MIHKVIQKCQQCNTPNSNHVKFIFGEGRKSKDFKKMTEKNITIWTSTCTKCGAKDGKFFKKDEA